MVICAVSYGYIDGDPTLMDAHWGTWTISKLKKRLFHIAINVLKKNRIMRDRVQWDWRVVNYELAKKCLSEEAALEVRPKGQEPVMKAIICPLMSRSTCMFMSPACWFSPHEPISLRAKTVSRWSLHHSPNKTEQSIG